jgi:hypothetical protein
VLDAEETDALDAPGPAAVALDIVALVLEEPAPAFTGVLEGFVPERFVPEELVPEEPWFEPPPQSPVGIPHPLPPAMGHHFGSGWVGDQSVIGMST